MASYTGKPLRIVLYARQSVDRAEGKSVRDQITTGKRWIAAGGHETVDVFHDDGISASAYSRKHRPDWAKAMHTVRSGQADALWLWTVARASRDRQVYVDLVEACKASGTLLIIKSKVFDVRDYDDAYSLDVESAQAVRLSGEISANTKQGIVGRLADGGPLGQPAYGYKVVYDAETGAAMGRYVDPPKQAILREMVDRLLGGDTLSQVADSLVSRGVPAPRGGKWTPDAVRKVVLNPVAAGLLRHHRQLAVNDAGEALRGNFDAIVTAEEHESLNTLFSGAGPGSRDGQVKHLLTGIAVCGKRVSPEVARRLRNSPRAPARWAPVGEPDAEGHVECGLPCRWGAPHNHIRYATYQCRPGHHLSRQADALDDYIAEVVIERLSRPDAEKVLLARETPDETRQAAVDEAARLRAVLADADDRLANGAEGVTLDWVVSLRTRLAPKIAAAEATAKPVRPEVTTALGVAGPDARTRWKGLHLSQKRMVIRVLLTPVILPSRRGAKGFNPELVRIDWQ